MELQRKLADIARPTPFSQQAIQRMEQRKHVLDETNFQADILMGKNRLWVNISKEFKLQFPLTSLENIVIFLIL